MIDRRPASFASTAVAILAFGVAFGYVEAAVVVYLRAALGLAPAGLVSVHDPATFGAFEGVEIARELATLVMIGAVGWLAGRSGLERLAWAGPFGKIAVRLRAADTVAELVHIAKPASNLCAVLPHGEFERGVKVGSGYDFCTFFAF